MTKRANAMMTMKQAIDDFNNTTEMVDDIGAYIEWMAMDICPELFLDAERDAKKREQIRWERETEVWLRNHSNNPEDPNYSEIYSDVFKEMYGVRPRW